MTGPAVDSPPPPESSFDLAAIQKAWPAVLLKLGEKAPALAATFEGARPVAFDGDTLEVAFPADKTFNKRKAESPDRREAVIDALAAVTGGAFKTTYVLLEGEPPPDTPAPGSEEIDEDELLERLKSEFDAEEVS